jgi:hypothetical protein
MLNNLTNYPDLIRLKAIVDVPQDTDLITLGVRNPNYDGDYRPALNTYRNFADSILAQVPTPVPGITNVNIANTLFVDGTYGVDATAQVNSLTKPFKTILAARNAATSGTIIYVQPGTYLYDNTNVTGNQFNGNMDTLVNLWKNGVTYYFTEGSKIVFANQINTGQDMYLFRPYSTTSFERCNVFGKLEFIATSVGTGGTGGNTNFFFGEEVGGATALGYEFNCEMFSSTSTVGGFTVVRTNTVGSQAIINLTIDKLVNNYAGVGQIGTGAMLVYRQASDVRFNIYAKYIESAFAYPFMIRNTNLTATFNANVEVIRMNGTLPVIQSQINNNKNISININACYFSTTIVTALQGNEVINLSGNFYQVSDVSTSTIFNLWNSGSATLNFRGNLFVASPTPAICYTQIGTQTLNFNGNITINPGVTYTGSLIYNDNGTINFNGNVIGTFAGIIANTRGASSITNVTNTNINGASGSQLLTNALLTTATTSFTGCKIILSNATALILNSAGNIQILNSTIENSGAGNLVTSNATVGQIQVLNSTLIVNSALETLTISGTTPVYTVNSATNKVNTIASLNGTFTVLAGINII